MKNIIFFLMLAIGMTACHTDQQMSESTPETIPNNGTADGSEDGSQPNWGSANGNGNSGNSSNGSSDDTGNTDDTGEVEDVETEDTGTEETETETDDGDIDGDGDGWTPNQGDCDDGWPYTNPAEDEWCDDGADNDCDGDIDESDCNDGTVDEDGDGYEAGDDCDDTDASVHPGAMEVCDGIDNDCNGTTDGYWSWDAPIWYLDADSDGYGDSSNYTWECSQPSGYVSNNVDCDDTDKYRNPGEVEVLDIRDNDCDGVQDELGNERLYRHYRKDSDGDLQHRFSSSSSLIGWSADGEWVGIYPSNICSGSYAPNDGCVVNTDGTIDLWGGAYALSMLSQCTDNDFYVYTKEDSVQYTSLVDDGWTCYSVGAVLSLSGAAYGDMPDAVDIYRHYSFANSDYMYSATAAEGDNSTDQYYVHTTVWAALDAS